MNQWLQTHIEFLKGVGPQRAKILRDELGIATYFDLLYHFPFRYIDRSKFHLIKDIPQIDGYVQLKGQIVSVSETGSGRQKRLNVKFRDFRYALPFLLQLLFFASQVVYSFSIIEQPWQKNILALNPMNAAIELFRSQKRLQDKQVCLPEKKAGR